MSLLPGGVAKREVIHRRRIAGCWMDHRGIKYGHGGFVSQLLLAMEL